MKARLAPMETGRRQVLAQQQVPRLAGVPFCPVPFTITPASLPDGKTEY